MTNSPAMPTSLPAGTWADVKVSPILGTTASSIDFLAFGVGTVVSFSAAALADAADGANVKDGAFFASDDGSSRAVDGVVDVMGGALGWAGVEPKSGFDSSGFEADA